MAAVAPAVVSPDVLISQVVKLKDQSPYKLLSLSPLGITVSRETSLFDSRRCYMKLAQVIHPDRNKGNSKATEAFQSLVAAFEIVANPDENQAELQQREEDAEGEKNTKRQKKKASGVGSSTTRQKKPVARQKKEKSSAPKPKKVKKSSNTTSTGKSKTSEHEEEDDDSNSCGSNDEDSSYFESSEDSGDVDSDLELLGLVDTQAQIHVPRARVILNPAQRKKKVDDLKKRNSNCFRTTVQCPKCREVWLPDDNRLYTMFMSFGLKVHCQTCLFKFGAITGLHSCPCCRRGALYDPSQYHKQVTCNRETATTAATTNKAAKPYCGKTYGYTFYTVGEDVLEGLRQDAKKQAALEEKRKERDRRASGGAHGGFGRNDDGDASEERELELIGQCMIDDQCPICKKAVYKKQRDHVRNCIAHPPAPKKTRGGASSGVVALAAVVVDKTGRVLAGSKVQATRAPRAKVSHSGALPAPGGSVGTTNSAVGSKSKEPTTPSPPAKKKAAAPKKAPALKKAAATNKKKEATSATGKKKKMQPTVKKSSTRGKRNRRGSSDSDSSSCGSSSSDSSGYGDDESSAYSDDSSSALSSDSSDDSSSV